MGSEESVTRSIADKLIEALTKEQPDGRGPFYVYDWMYDLYRDYVERIAKYYFNGEVVVLPDKVGGEAHELR